MTSTIQRLILFLLASLIAVVFEMKAHESSPFATVMFVLAALCGLVLLPYRLTGLRMLPDAFYVMVDFDREKVAWEDRGILNRIGLIIHEAAFLCGCMGFVIGMAGANINPPYRVLAYEVAAWSALLVASAVSVRRLNWYFRHRAA
jgi:hypothetical protein